MARGKLAEMVEAEAAIAEAETTDEDDEAADAEGEPDEDEDEGSGDPDAEDDAEDDGRSLEAVAKSLEAEIARHDRELSRILGADYDEMQACYTCGGMGAVPILAPLPDPKSERCPECNGFGSFVTESMNENHVSKTCLRCGGFGWIDKILPLPPPAPPQNTAGVWSPPPATTPTPPPNGGGAPIPPMPQYDATRNVWLDPNTGEVLGGASPGQSVPAVTP